MLGATGTTGATGAPEQPAMAITAPTKILPKTHSQNGPKKTRRTVNTPDEFVAKNLLQQNRQQGPQTVSDASILRTQTRPQRLEFQHERGGTVNHVFSGFLYFEIISSCY
jgi:hypothetical protein